MSGCASFTERFSNESTNRAARSSNGSDDKPGVIGQATDIVDEAREAASLRFLNFMADVDGFFGDGGDKVDAVSNQSWARIRLDTEKPGDEDIDVGGSLKLRAILPETERRFRLLLSTEDDDTDNSGDTISSINDDDQNVSLALRFIRTAREKASVNFDLGVRQRDDQVQLFGRINNIYRDELGNNWTGRYSNSYYYFSRSGFENRLTIAFQRLFNDRQDLYFRTSTGFNWRNGQKGAVIDETLGVYRRISETKSLAIEGLASYHTALNAGVDDRFRGSELRIRWRHSIWRDWFFYEFWPSVSWPASNGYSGAFGALFRVEVVIGQQ